MSPPRASGTALVGLLALTRRCHTAPPRWEHGQWAVALAGGSSFPNRLGEGWRRTQECLGLPCICVPSLQPQRTWGDSVMLSSRRPALPLASPSLTDVSGDFFSLFRDCPGCWSREDPTVSRQDYVLARVNASQVGAPNSFSTHF